MFSLHKFQDRVVMRQGSKCLSTICKLPKYWSVCKHLAYEMKVLAWKTLLDKCVTLVKEGLSSSSGAPRV